MDSLTRPHSGAPTWTVLGWAAAALLLGCSVAGDSDAEVEPLRAPTTVEAGPVAAISLGAGDCIQGVVLGQSERVEVSEVELVPCAWPHPVEVYAVLPLDPAELGGGDGYPGMARVVVASQELCRASVGRYTERADRYGLLALWPTRRSWEAGDRSVACAVFSPSGERFEGPELVGSDQPDDAGSAR